MRSPLPPVRILLGVIITILLLKYFGLPSGYGVFSQGEGSGQIIAIGDVGVGEAQKHSSWRAHLDLHRGNILAGDSHATRQSGVLKTQRGGHITTRTWSTSDGDIKHFLLERETPVTGTETSVLYLTITRDAESWGRNPNESGRTIYSYLQMITNTTLSGARSSVGLLTSSQDEFDKYIDVLSPSPHDAGHSKFDFPFRRVTVILHQAPTRELVPGSEAKAEDPAREARHNIPQHERRARLAKLRNYLQTVALDSESHVLWTDADVYKWSDDKMVETMMETTTTTPEAEVGVLAARCRRGEPEKADAWLAQHPSFKIPDRPKDEDPPEKRAEIDNLRGRPGGDYEIIAHRTNRVHHYDLNSWNGKRVKPTEAQQKDLWNDITSWTPGAVGQKETVMLDWVIRDTTNAEIRRMDSVGGTVLMIRADLIRMGLIFPPGYFVGMTWEHGEGYDGIESEGICLLTRSMSRDGNSTCFAMGGSWAVWHTVY